MKTGSATRVHHIGVNVKNVEETMSAWEMLFDTKGKIVQVTEHFRIGVLNVAGVTFFFNENTDPERKADLPAGLTAPVIFGGHQIVNEHGEGITHIAFESTNLDYHIGKARDAGMDIKHDTHKDSLEGMCNFIDPNKVSLPLEFMMPVEGRENPLE